MDKINEQLVHDAEVQRTGGQYNNVNMLHQYGAGNQDLLLMSNSGASPSPRWAEVPSQRAGSQLRRVGHQCGNHLEHVGRFHPGYMYTLTENIDKVRAEETKNKEARDKEGYDPGGVANGLQNQFIQPLVLRGNQGDCVKLTLRNQLEGDEEVSLNIHGSSMVMSATGQPATTTNPDSIAGKGCRGDGMVYPRHSRRAAASSIRTATIVS